MNVRPTQSGQTARTDASRTDRERMPSVQVPGNTAESRTARQDQVQISNAARELHGRASHEEAANAGLSAERLGTILRRFADGHYDRPEVVDAIANGVLRDM